MREIEWWSDCQSENYDVGKNTRVSYWQPWILMHDLKENSIFTMLLLDLLGVKKMCISSSNSIAQFDWPLLVNL
jgi:hypothetical protein